MCEGLEEQLRGHRETNRSLLLTRLFAHGFIPVCLYIRFWEECLWSVICLCPAWRGGDTSFPSDWNQIDQPYQFTVQEGGSARVT